MRILALKCPPLPCVIRQTFEDVSTKPLALPPAAENVLQVQMPSSAYGHSVLNVKESTLVREYSTLWYEEPQNFKQKASNTFILKMCSAAEWQFTTKKKLYLWARNERDIRWNAMLSFADCNEVESETPYFQNQCIQYCVEALLNQYTFAARAAEDKDPSLHPRNHPQVEEYNKELKSLESWAQNGLAKAEKKLNAAKGKHGHGEEELFWGVLIKKAQKVVSFLEEKAMKATTLQQAYCDAFGERSTASQKADIRKKQKNQKKNMKRRAETKMGGQAVSNKVSKRSGGSMNAIPIMHCFAAMGKLKKVPTAGRFRPGICMCPLA